MRINRSNFGALVPGRYAVPETPVVPPAVVRAPQPAATPRLGFTLQDISSSNWMACGVAGLALLYLCHNHMTDAASTAGKEPDESTPAPRPRRKAKSFFGLF